MKIFIFFVLFFIIIIVSSVLMAIFFLRHKNKKGKSKSEPEEEGVRHHEESRASRFSDWLKKFFPFLGILVFGNWLLFFQFSETYGKFFGKFFLPWGLLLNALAIFLGLVVPWWGIELGGYRGWLAALIVGLVCFVGYPHKAKFAGVPVIGDLVEWWSPSPPPPPTLKELRHLKVTPADSPSSGDIVVTEVVPGFHWAGDNDSDLGPEVKVGDSAVHLSSKPKFWIHQDRLSQIGGVRADGLVDGITCKSVH